MPRGMQVSRTEAYGVMGQAVRATRTALNLTVTEFGRRVGVNHANVCQWETGFSKPSLLRAMRIGAIAQGELRAWWISHVLQELKASGADVAAFLSECVSADEQQGRGKSLVGLTIPDRQDAR
jgi:transcriptional regulator with XRE-family HTH domain